MEYSSQVERTAYAVRLALIVAFLLLVLWIAGRILLVIFAGLLLAIMLQGLTVELADRMRMSRGWALFLLTATLLGVLAATLYLLMPRIITQSVHIFDNARLGIEELFRQVSGILPETTFPADKLPNLRQITSGFFHFGSTVTDAVVTVIIILFVGFYTAVGSSWYVSGFIGLFPAAKRDPVREILTETGRSLRWWLLGRASAMLCVAILTAVALSLLSIPLAVTLGLLTGLLTFIPYIGALIAAVPTMLVGFAQSPLEALYVLVVYVGIHVVEGYILIPLIQQRTVHMPPALLLCAQVFFGTLFGIAGVALAAPLTVVVMVVTRIVYLRDMLGSEESPEPAKTASPSDRPMPHADPTNLP